MGSFPTWEGGEGKEGSHMKPCTFLDGHSLAVLESHCRAQEWGPGTPRPWYGHPAGGRAQQPARQPAVHAGLPVQLGGLEVSPRMLCASMHGPYHAAGPALHPRAGRASIRAHRDGAHLWKGSLSGRGAACSLHKLTLLSQRPLYKPFK